MEGKVISPEKRAKPKMKPRATWKSCYRKEPGSYCRERSRTKWPSIWKYTESDEPMKDRGDRTQWSPSGTRKPNPVMMLAKLEAGAAFQVALRRLRHSIIRSARGSVDSSAEWQSEPTFHVIFDAGKADRKRCQRLGFVVAFAPG
jgi:hypothetical protein